MPLYEYECTACHRRTEKIQKFSDPELTECPYCGGPLQRTLNAPAVHFAGGGWYKDLYSSPKPAAATGESKPGGTEAPAAAGTSTEGSPASAAPAASAPATTAPPATASKAGS